MSFFSLFIDVQKKSSREWKFTFNGLDYYQQKRRKEITFSLIFVLQLMRSQRNLYMVGICSTVGKMSKKNLRSFVKSTNTKKGHVQTIVFGQKLEIRVPWPKKQVCCLFLFIKYRLTLFAYAMLDMEAHWGPLMLSIMMGVIWNTSQRIKTLFKLLAYFFTSLTFLKAKQDIWSLK